MRIRAEVLLKVAAGAAGMAVVFSAPAAPAQADPDCASGQPASHSCTHGFCPSGEVVSAAGDCGSDNSIYGPHQQAPVLPPMLGLN